VDLFAPGDGILSCYPQRFCNHYCNASAVDHYSDGYHYMSGSSMAAPYVTGVAALILAKYPTLTATQIKTRIMESVDPVFVLSSKCVTGGRLNAYKAVHPHTIVCTTTDLDHTYGCACGFIQSSGVHSFGPKTFKGYVCTVCGYVKSDPILSSGDESEIR
jgi:hypothetical protein